MTIKHTIKNQINQVLKKHYKLNNVNFQIEYPPQSEMGDYSCNVAMVLTKQLKKNSIKIANQLSSYLNGHLNGHKIFSKIEVAKPGFINFYLSEKVLLNNIKEILKQKNKFGQTKPDKKEYIQVEFISANPTGPLHIGNGRGGFTGDVLANILELAGHKVQREYLVNDYGGQIRKLAHSILKDDKAQYEGEYINELIKKMQTKVCEPRLKSGRKKDAEEIGQQAAGIILEKYIKPAVEKINIKYDNWFLESELHKKGKVDKMFDYLKKKNLVYKKDGAYWLKTRQQLERLAKQSPKQDGSSQETWSQQSGDDKDRVLIKSDGSKTYFLADIAYHWNKFHDRKFDKVINLWGADHHGYIARMKSAVALLGYPNQLDILLMQLVRLVENGKEIKMSKRKGVYILLEDLVDEVGLDVTRFFFLMHANNKAMDFDLKLAKEKSQKNPVYYVQYAHARICSLLTKAQKAQKAQKAHEMTPSERELIKELIKWPEIVQEVAQSYEVHKIPFYTIALADKFHDFYENCKVIENNQVNKFRLELIKATQQVLQNSLRCLGVSYPEKM